MEAIAAFGTIWTLLGVIKNTIELVKDLKDTSEDRKLLAEELNANRRLLEFLGSLTELELTSLPNISKLLGPDGALASFEKYMRQLSEKAEVKHGVRAISSKIKFILQSKDLKETLETLEHYKSTMLGFISGDILGVNLRLEKKIGAVNLQINTLRVSYQELKIPSRLEEKLDVLGAQVDTLRASNDANTPALEQRLDTLNTQVSSLRISHEQSERTGPILVDSPFSHDPNSFVPRLQYTSALESGFVSHDRMFLYGLGGVGKSQLAISFAKNLRQANKSLSFLWVYAGSHSTFIEPYNKIALQIPSTFHDKHQKPAIPI